MLSFKDLDEMVQSREYEAYTESLLGNDLFINDPDRANRIYEAAEHGCDGSTHAECLGDMRGFLKTLKVYDPECDDEDKCDLTQEVYDRISSDIDHVEAWHEKNGSLDKQVG